MPRLISTNTLLVQRCFLVMGVIRGLPISVVGLLPQPPRLVLRQRRKRARRVDGGGCQQAIPRPRVTSVMRVRTLTWDKKVERACGGDECEGQCEEEGRCLLSKPPLKLHTLQLDNNKKKHTPNAHTLCDHNVERRGRE